MKRVLLALFLLVGSIIFISSCTTENGTICNGICNTLDSCSCANCKTSDFCTNRANESCENNAVCTISYYDPAISSCVHKSKPNCCGNGICEGTEMMCNSTTAITSCSGDCGLKCPAKLIVAKDNTGIVDDPFSFVCMNSRCQQNGDDRFTISGDSGVQTTIINVGERSSDTLISSFYCTQENSEIKIAIENNNNFQGITFKNYFNDNQKVIDSINSRVSKENYVVYTFSLNSTTHSAPISLNCQVKLSSALYLTSIQNLKITVI
jgi:hypothetical protein